MDEEVDDIEEQPAAVTASALWQAREKLKLTQKDVAARLRMHLHIIAAIDNNQFDKLAAPAYVRGYLRAYANLVGLDPTPILQDYNENHAGSTPDILPYQSQPAQQHKSNDRWVKIFTLFIIVILLILLGSWLKNRYYDSPPVAVIISPQEIEEIRVIHAEHEIPKYQDLSESQPVYMNESTPVDEFIPPAEEDEIIIPEVPPLPVSAASLAENTAAQAESGTLDTTMGETETTVEKVIPATGDIKLLTHGKAWIEISDSTSKKLYFNLAKPDTTIIVSGIAPYSVLVGNSEKVNFEYRQKAFDMSPFSLEGVARFILNEDGTAVEGR